MKRDPWGVRLLISLVLIGGGSRVAFMGWSVVGIYGDDPEPYYIIALGALAVVLGIMLIVIRWASGADSGQAE